jgi:hypothetical protein
VTGRKAIACCLAAAAAGLIMLGVPAGASATGTVPWGFNEEWGWPNGAPSGTFAADTANTHMQLAGAIMPDAMSANRFGVQWAYVEGRRGTYDWSRSDALYGAMQRYTPNPIMTL